MENFDNLVISLLDSDTMKGVFKKEISKALNIPTIYIYDIWLETTLINNVASQELYVKINNVDIDKNRLMDLPFKSIYNDCIVFEVGDSIL